VFIIVLFDSLNLQKKFKNRLDMRMPRMEAGFFVRMTGLFTGYGVGYVIYS
jgi:hypothetical protein